VTQSLIHKLNWKLDIKRLKNIKLTWRKIDPNNFVESDTHWTCCKDKTWQGPSKAIVAWTHENIQTVAWLATEILNISCANWVLGHNNFCSGIKIGKVLYLFQHTLCPSYINLYWNMSAHLVQSCCYHCVSVVIFVPLPRYSWNIVESGFKHHKPLVVENILHIFIDIKKQWSL